MIQLFYLITNLNLVLKVNNTIGIGANKQNRRKLWRSGNVYRYRHF